MRSNIIFRSVIVFILGVTQSATGFSNDKKPNIPEFEGVIVKYRTFPDRKIIDKKQILERLKAKISYRSDLVPIDAIILLDSEKNEKEPDLNALCKEYLKNQEVVRCELNRRLQLDSGRKSTKSDAVKSIERANKEISSFMMSPSAQCALDGKKKPYFLIKPCTLHQTHPDLDKPTTLDGKLTPFWAQEYIGADLARAVVTNAQGTQPVPIGVFDAGYDIKALSKEKLSYGAVKNLQDDADTTHGTAVTHLIGGSSAVSVCPKANFTTLFKANLSSDILEGTDAIEKMKRIGSPNKPRIINTSMRLETSMGEQTESDRESYERLSKHAILVFSAGNYYPKHIDKIKANLRCINVGNLSPFGTMDTTSSEGPSVVISAPSSDYIQSIKDSTGKMKPFGGTSGAAPLVTGALANVLSFIPDLTTEEAKILLRKTALPTANSYDVPQLNGAGMLNAYKLARVAEKLKNDKNWKKLESGEDRIKYLHEHSELYDFKKEAQEHIKKAKKLYRFPAGCAAKKEALSYFRAAFLLDPTSEARKKLEEIYQKNGFEYNALFYKSLDYPKGYLGMLSESSGDPKRREINSRDKNTLYKKQITLYENLTGPHRHHYSKLYSIDEKDITSPGGLLLTQDEFERNSFHMAAINGDYKLLDSIATRNPALFAEGMKKKDKIGHFPLNLAAVKGHTKIFEFIATKNPELFTELMTLQNKSGEYPLHAAAKEGHTEIFEFIATQKPELFEELMKKKDKMGQTLLHFAAREGHKKIFDFVAAKDPYFFIKQMETKNVNGKTPLDLSSVDLQKDLKVLMDESMSFLRSAAKEGELDIFESLATKDPNFFAQLVKQTDEGGLGVLHSAALGRKEKVFDFIATKDPKLFAELMRQQDRNGSTPLHMAASLANIKLFNSVATKDPKLFIELMEMVDSDGMTPLTEGYKISEELKVLLDKTKKALLK